MGNLKYYIKLLRPLNLFIIALSMVLFMLKADNFNMSNLRWPELIYVILSVVLTAAGGYVINDIFDIEADNINRPHKRIIAKHISLRSANIFYVCILAASILCGFLTGLGLGLLVMAVNVLLYFYSSDLKGTVLWGNLLVALLSGIVVYSAQKGVYSANHAYVAEYALLAFCITMARELIKDIEDMEGDKAQGYKTFPIVVGITWTRLLTQFFLLAVVADLIYLFTLTGTGYFIPYVLIFVLLPLAWVSVLIFRAKDSRDQRRISTLLKIIMISGLVSVLFSR